MAEFALVSSASQKSAVEPATPPPTPPAELERSLGRLAENAHVFAATPPRVKAFWLREVRARFLELAPRMVELGCRARGIDPASPLAGEVWLSGPAISLRALRLFAKSLDEVAERGVPSLPAPPSRSPDERVSVGIHPLDDYDRALFLGIRCEAWFERGVTPATLAEHQASFYRQRDPGGHVVLVLGAGNVGSISVLDVLYHSFVEGAVCVLKMNPVNGYLGPLIEQAFAPMVQRGFLSIVHGGSDVGAVLVEHPAVDAIHVTGSVETHDRIVWGPPGPERERRKREAQPLTKKRVTSELGNVSPGLVVPDRYTERELERIARSVAGMVINNASFNCNALKLLVTARGWPQREDLLRRIGRALSSEPARFAYYPGARERYQRWLGAAAGTEIESFGEESEGRLPWTLAAGADARAASELFEVEPFCGVLSEATLDADGAVEFLDRATRFANERVFGTLNAMLFVSESLERDTGAARALDRALVELRYGTVAVNVWPAVSFGLGAPPWGGAPGAKLSNAQSGIGWGHNALLLDCVHKVVIRSPLLSFPEPFWCPGHRALAELGRSFAEHEGAPSPWRAARVAWAGTRG